MADGFRATWIGLKKLHQQLRRAHELALKAAAVSVEETSKNIQKALRTETDNLFSGGSAQFRRGRKGPGRRPSGGIRRKTYDNRDRGSAAVIYSRFGKREGGRFVDYLGPYLSGRDILPRRGRYMAIPLQPGRRNANPKTVKNLVPVNIGGRLYLVRNTRRRTTFFFLLVPRVRIRKRLAARRIMEREGRRMGIIAQRSFGKI